MESREIKRKEGKGIRIVLLENIFPNGDSNYSVVSFLKKGNRSLPKNSELSREVFNTLRKAKNKFVKY